MYFFEGRLLNPQEHTKGPTFSESDRGVFCQSNHKYEKKKKKTNEDCLLAGFIHNESHPILQSPCAVHNLHLKVILSREIAIQPLL